MPYYFHHHKTTNSGTTMKWYRYLLVYRNVFYIQNSEPIHAISTHSEPTPLITVLTISLLRFSIAYCKVVTTSLFFCRFCIVFFSFSVSIKIVVCGISIDIPKFFCKDKYFNSIMQTFWCFFWFFRNKGLQKTFRIKYDSYHIPQISMLIFARTAVVGVNQQWNPFAHLRKKLHQLTITSPSKRWKRWVSTEEEPWMMLFLSKEDVDLSEIPLNYA